MADLLEIARFSDPEEALCAQSYLRSFGIDALLQNENHAAMQPALRIALGGYRLIAPTYSAEDARIALADLPPSAADWLEPAPRASRNWIFLPIALFGGEAPFLPRYASGSAFVLQTFAASALIASLIAAVAYWR